MEEPGSVLEFWFGRAGDALKSLSERTAFWFGAEERTDRQIRDRFNMEILQAASGEFMHWEASPRGRLALILLFDAFPRRAYRGMPRAYVYEGLGLELCLRSIDEGLDMDLALLERSFFYFPLMHSESARMQEKSLHYFELLARLAHRQAPVSNHCTSLAEWARSHSRVIVRFGRYPQRNAVLSRPSTPEEMQYLQESGKALSEC